MGRSGRAASSFRAGAARFSLSFNDAFMAPTDEDELQRRVRQIREEAGATSVGVAFYDYESRNEWSYRGEEWFHAASTIKVPILVGVLRAVHLGDLTLASRVHVRNRFLSVLDGEPFRVSSGRDANSAVHSARGKTMKVEELAHHMIVTSSNLATNLLIDIVGLEAAQAALRELGVDGIELQRGVEDERAYDADINNRVTARGMLDVLRLIEEGRAFSAEASGKMLEILHEQEFRSGIPAGVPDDARVANKTGEISTVAHDVGIVYLPDRKPYAVVILTEWSPKTTSGRSDTIARISRAVYEHLREVDERG